MFEKKTRVDQSKIGLVNDGYGRDGWTIKSLKKNPALHTHTLSSCE